MGWDEIFKAYLVWVLFVFTLASTLSIIDRQIINVMIGPIKETWAAFLILKCR